MLKDVYVIVKEEHGSSAIKLVKAQAMRDLLSLDSM